MTSVVLAGESGSVTEIIEIGPDRAWCGAVRGPISSRSPTLRERRADDHQLAVRTAGQ